MSLFRCKECGESCLLFDDELIESKKRGFCPYCAEEIEGLEELDPSKLSSGGLGGMDDE